MEVLCAEDVEGNSYLGTLSEEILVPHNTELLEKIEASKDKFKAIWKSNQSWLQKVFELAKLIVTSVEEVTADAETVAKLTGAEKKQLALHFLNDVYFDRWESKKIPNALESWVLNFVAGKAIDRAVAYFNTIGVFKHAS